MISSFGFMRVPHREESSPLIIPIAFSHSELPIEHQYVLLICHYSLDVRSFHGGALRLGLLVEEGLDLKKVITSFLNQVTSSHNYLVVSLCISSRCVALRF